MSRELNLERIKQLIPHREPILLVEKVIDVIIGQSATGIKHLKETDPFFAGHFPGKPVMPGVLIVEALAQTSALVVADSFKEAEGKIVYFTSIHEARFRKPVLPGDTMFLHVKKLQSKRNLFKFETKCTVNDIVVAEAVISAMIML